MNDDVLMPADARLADEQAEYLVSVCVRTAELAEDDLVVEVRATIDPIAALFRRLGLRVVESDPADDVARAAIGGGTRAAPSRFGPAAGDSIVRDHGRAALVLVRDPPARIDDIHGFLDGVKAVLAPEGTLALGLPYLINPPDHDRCDATCHARLSGFSLGSLDRLLRTHGLYAVDVDRVAAGDGSILVFVARVKLGRPVESSVTELLDLETAWGIDTGAPHPAIAPARAAIANRTGYRCLGTCRDREPVRRSPGRSCPGFG